MIVNAVLLKNDIAKVADASSVEPSRPINNRPMNPCAYCKKKPDISGSARVSIAQLDFR